MPPSNEFARFRSFCDALKDSIEAYEAFRSFCDALKNSIEAYEAWRLNVGDTHAPPEMIKRYFQAFFASKESLVPKVLAKRPPPAVKPWKVVRQSEGTISERICQLLAETQGFLTFRQIREVIQDKTESAIYMALSNLQRKQIVISHDLIGGTKGWSLSPKGLNQIQMKGESDG